MYTPKDFDITRIMRDIVELVGTGTSPSGANGGSAANGSHAATPNGSPAATPDGTPAAA